VKELRDSWDDCTDDAADEIERLRARVEELEKISVTVEGDKITLYVNGEPRFIVSHVIGFGEITIGAKDD
jgi:hypothetical protein